MSGPAHFYLDSYLQPLVLDLCLTVDDNPSPPSSSSSPSTAASLATSHPVLARAHTKLKSAQANTSPIGTQLGQLACVPRSQTRIGQRWSYSAGNFIVPTVHLDPNRDALLTRVEKTRVQQVVDLRLVLTEEGFLVPTATASSAGGARFAPEENALQASGPALMEHMDLFGECPVLTMSNMCCSRVDCEQQAAERLLSAAAEAAAGTPTPALMSALLARVPVSFAPRSRMVRSRFSSLVSTVKTHSSALLSAVVPFFSRKRRGSQGGGDDDALRGMVDASAAPAAPHSDLQHGVPLAKQQWSISTEFDTFLDSLQTVLDGVAKVLDAEEADEQEQPAVQEEEEEEREPEAEPEADDADASDEDELKQPDSASDSDDLFETSEEPTGVSAASLYLSMVGGDSSAPSADVPDEIADEPASHQPPQQASEERDADQLEFVMEYAFDHVWDSKEARARCKTPLSLWRPVPLPGCVIFGDLAVASASAPSRRLAIARDHPRAFAPPASFRLAWHDIKAKLYLWELVPPSPDFVALGMVATTSPEVPLVDQASQLRCVHVSYLQIVNRGVEIVIWDSDGMSQGDKLATLWRVVGANTFTIGLGERRRPCGGYYTFHPTGKPQLVDPLSVQLQPTLAYHFERVWDDNGTRAELPVSVWRPVLPAGFVAFGDYAHASRTKPKAAFDQMLVVRDHPAFRRPAGYKNVWQQKRGRKSLWVWLPDPPSGEYVALGCVCTTTPEPPPLDLVRVVWQGVLSEVSTRRRFPYQIWNDRKTGGIDGAFWTMPLRVRTFMVSPGTHARPPGYLPCFDFRDEVLPRMHEVARVSDVEAQRAMVDIHAVEVLDECVDRLEAMSAARPEQDQASGEFHYRECAALLGPIHFFLHYFTPSDELLRTRGPLRLTPSRLDPALGDLERTLARASSLDNVSPSDDDEGGEFEARHPQPGAVRGATISRQTLSRMHRVIRAFTIKIRQRVLRDLRAFLCRSFHLDRGDLVERVTELAHGCAVLDLLPGDAVPLVVGFVVDLQLRAYLDAFTAELNDEDALLSQACTRRLAWIKRRLRRNAQEDFLHRLFPTNWNVQGLLCERFCLLMRLQIESILSTQQQSLLEEPSAASASQAQTATKSHEAAMTYATDLLKAMNICRGAERDMQARYSSPDLTVEHDDEHVFGDANSSFYSSHSAHNARRRAVSQQYHSSEVRGSARRPADEIPWHPSKMVRTSPTVVEFIGLISPAFEPYLGPYVELEVDICRMLVRQVAHGGDFRRDARLFQHTSLERPRYASAEELATSMYSCLSRVSEVSPSQPLLQFFQTILDVAVEYCDAVLQRLPPANGARAIKGEGLDEHVSPAASAFFDPNGRDDSLPTLAYHACLCVNTVSHIHDRMRALHVKISRDLLAGGALHGRALAEATELLEARLADLDELLHARLNAALSYLNDAFAAALAVYFHVGIVQRDWSQFADVGDVSTYVRQVRELVVPRHAENAQEENLMASVKKLLTPAHFSFFFTLLTSETLHPLHESAIFATRSLSSHAAQQLLLDTQLLREAVLAVHVRSRSVKRHVSKHFGMLESALKVMTSEEPAMMLQTFHMLFPGGSGEDLELLLRTRGFRKAKVNFTVVLYNKKVRPQHGRAFKHGHAAASSTRSAWLSTVSTGLSTVVWGGIKVLQVLDPRQITRRRKQVSDADESA